MRCSFLKDIPNHVIREVGDTIVTSGYSIIFPEGKVIGTISDFQIYRKKQSNFVDIRVKLATDFKNLGYIYIIGNIDKEAQLELEERAIND